MRTGFLLSATEFRLGFTGCGRVSSGLNGFDCSFFGVFLAAASASTTSATSAPDGSAAERVAVVQH